MSYENSPLILSLHGANGGTSFPDYSRYNRAVTPNGNAQTSTAQSQFYGSSGLFDGSGDYLSLLADDANWRFNTAGFCVECWVRMAAVDQLEYLIAHKSGNNNGWIFVVTAEGQLTFLHWNTAGADYIRGEAAHGMSANTWYHLAADWDGTTLRVFVNGSSVGSSTTVTGTIQHASDGSLLLIGRDVQNILARDFTGHMQDVRITRASRYTANFTPPGKLIGTLSNQGTGGEAVKDDTGTAAVRRIYAVPRIQSPTVSRLPCWTAASDGSGLFSISAPSAAEFSDISGYSVIALDDAAGTTYNDLVHAPSSTT